MKNTPQDDVSEAILEIKNATVFRKNTRVFNDLSLTLHKGVSTAILGPNGAGKTTFLKLLARELYPVEKTGSQLKIFGRQHINIWQLRKKMGFVSQEFQASYEAIASGLDVVTSAFFGSVGIHSHQQVTSEQKRKALTLMEELGLVNLIEQQYLSLSTGQQRRLLLARALIHEPEVLVFDEPTNGLDITTAFKLLEDIRQWCRAPKTLILVTHHLQEIIPEIQHVVLLKKGELIAQGKKERLLTSETISELYDYPLVVKESEGFYTVSPAKNAGKYSS